MTRDSCLIMSLPHPSDIGGSPAEGSAGSHTGCVSPEFATFCKIHHFIVCFIVIASWPLACHHWSLWSRLRRWRMRNWGEKNHFIFRIIKSPTVKTTFHIRRQGRCAGRRCIHIWEGWCPQSPAQQSLWLQLFNFFLSVRPFILSSSCPGPSPGLFLVTIPT